MRRIFRTRRPTNFKLGRRTEPRFAKVTILIFYLEQPSATNQSTEQHEASRGLTAIAELLVPINENELKIVANDNYASFAFYRAMLCIARTAVARRPSVCPSICHTPVFY